MHVYVCCQHVYILVEATRGLLRVLGSKLMVGNTHNKFIYKGVLDLLAIHKIKKMQITSCLICKFSTMLTWDLLMQLQGWFPSMHSHHAWVLLEKFLSSDFWILEKPGLLHSASSPLFRFLKDPCYSFR
jgi:hypothetical protein